MSAPIKAAVVEIVDPMGDENGPILPRRVRINGTDVGFVAKDSLSINVGSGSDGDPTTVTLTLLVSKVIIRGDK